MSARLTSWTRTLNEDDALLLIEEAEAGLSLDEWTERGHDVLPQAGRDRRTELIRLVRENLLDWDGDVLADTRWLALMHRVNPGARRDLLHGRYLFDHPWILRVNVEVVGPRLEAAEVPLPERDIDRVTHAEWADFVVRTALPDTGPESLKKTRSVVLRNLARLGVIRREGDREEDARVCRGTPDPLAYGWLVAHEMRRTDTSECALGWAVHHARAATLFRPDATYAERCLNESVTAGLLRQSFIAGEPRLLLGAP